MKLDNKGAMKQKIILKGIKHSVWILFSAWTGFTFVGYFTPIVELGSKLMTFSTGPKDRIQHRYQLSVDGLDDTALIIDDASLQVAGATLNSFQVPVIANPGSLPSNVNLIRLEAQ